MAISGQFTSLENVLRPKLNDSNTQFNPYFKKVWFLHRLRKINCFCCIVMCQWILTTSYWFKSGAIEFCRDISFRAKFLARTSTSINDSASAVESINKVS